MEMETEGRRNLSMILIQGAGGPGLSAGRQPQVPAPEELGAGRFEALGLPFPHYLAPLVGGGEIAGGVAILLNIYAGDAALALLVVIVTALVTTKFPILLGRPLGPLPLETLKEYGWLSFFHQARTDFCMVLGLLAIVIDSGLRVGRKRRWYQAGPK
jgi:putative oxidoreductase